MAQQQPGQITQQFANLTHYIELQAVPQQEITLSAQLAHALQQIHRLLPAQGGQIGIGFPRYQRTVGLGGIVRLFGDENRLNYLQPQLGEMLSDYFIVSATQTIPAANQAVRYQRIQHKGASAIRRAEKRLTAQNNWTAEIAQKMQAKQQAVKRYPHVFLKSYTTGQNRFLLEIKEIACPQHQQGEFNSYGLSQTATVPHF